MNSRLAAVLAAGFALPVLAAWPVIAQRAGILLLASIWVLALLRSAQGWGRHLVGSSRDGAEAPATWMVAAGLLVLAAASYLLGAAGYFSRSAAGLLLLGGILLAGRATIPAVSWPRDAWPATPALVALLLVSGSPVIYWDAMAYHLAIPEHLALTGRLPLAPGYSFGFYPLAAESIFALIWWLPAGETATVGLSSVLFALAVHEALRERPELKGWGCALAFSLPAVISLMAIPKNSALLAFAIVVAWRGLAHAASAGAASGEAGVRGVEHGYRLAGIGLGLAAASHYFGAWVVLVLLAAHLAQGGLRVPRAAAWTLPGLVAGSSSYLRNALLVRNPFHPYLDEGALGIAATTTRVSMTWAHKLLAPLTEIEPFGPGSTLGGLLLLALVGWVLGRSRGKAGPEGRQDVAEVIAGSGLLLISMLVYAAPRFGIGGLLLMLPALAAGARSLGGAFLPVALLHSVVAAFLLLTPPTRPLDSLFLYPDAYRARVHPPHAAAMFARDRLPPTARIATVGVPHPYLWGGKLEYSSEDASPIVARLLEDARTGEELRERLRSAGYTHLVVHEEARAEYERRFGYFPLDARSRDVLAQFLALTPPIFEQSGVRLHSL